MHELSLVTRFATRSTTSVREPLKALLFLLSAGALATVAACGSSTTTNVIAPAGDPRCQASIQGQPTSFGHTGGTGTIQVGVARECSWSATATVPWIELTSGREGQGQGSISYRVAANQQPVNRSGRISVAEQRIDVSQQAAPCAYTVTRSAGSIGPEGGQIGVSVATHSACSWNAGTDAPWIAITPGSGTGNGTVQLTFAANSGADRTATVTVAGETLTFAQTATPSAPPPAPPPPSPPPPPPPQPPPPPEQCTFEIAPDQREFDAAGGPGAFTITTGAGCAWTATVNADWVTIVGASSGSGGAQVEYLVVPNVQFETRQATITVGGAAHSVRQAPLSGGDDDDDDEVRIRGVVSSLSGSCPALQFVVSGTTVTTTNSTDFRRGNCSHIANGLEVEIEGRRQTDGTIAARNVTLFRD